jgi:glycosyltransferase 2 family protein
MARLALSARTRRWAPLALGALVLTATATTVGGGPFLRGLEAVTPATVAAAALLTALASAAAAWRWHALATGIGVPLTRRHAFLEYYRSQFLNSVLPGGVLGDVNRAYRHARDGGDAGGAARAVAGERIAGQLVQLCISGGVLLALGMSSPFAHLAWAAAAIAAVGVLAVVVAGVSGRGRRMLRRELGLLGGLFSPPRSAFRTVATVVVASVVVLACHTTTFVVAALAVGVHASPRELIALALTALTVGSLPLNLGGWGPREASSALFTAAVGLGAGAGLAASAAFGALAVISVLPGGVLLLTARLAPHHRPPLTTGRTSGPAERRLA